MNVSDEKKDDNPSPPKRQRTTDTYAGFSKDIQKLGGIYGAEAVCCFRHTAPGVICESVCGTDEQSGQGLTGIKAVVESCCVFMVEEEGQTD